MAQKITGKSTGRRARCVCGHSYSAHRSCTWRQPHERGHCTAYVPVPVDIQQCPCEQYEPETGDEE